MLSSAGLPSSTCQAHWHRRREKHVAGAKGPVPGGHEPVPPVQRRQIVPAVGQSPAHPTLARASLPRLAVLPGHGHRGR